ncbi:hypothetical protein Purlil1_7265 [Purpureocillium lilacinum]|uniref:Uncharacterized protein n=1 Tax=Purpureocillium lilacinum TaxID=33203 RepID=A0ABR0BWZ7_PURLI|nr:hypothetical protein Purlil1_7265 [Purpureocillium lilacinum]
MNAGATKPLRSQGAFWPQCQGSAGSLSPKVHSDAVTLAFTNHHESHAPYPPAPPGSSRFSRDGLGTKTHQSDSVVPGGGPAADSGAIALDLASNVLANQGADINCLGQQSRQAEPGRRQIDSSAARQGVAFLTDSSASQPARGDFPVQDSGQSEGLGVLLGSPRPISGWHDARGPVATPPMHSTSSCTGFSVAARHLGNATSHGLRAREQRQLSKKRKKNPRRRLRWNLKRPAAGTSDGRGRRRGRAVPSGAVRRALVGSQCRGLAPPENLTAQGSDPLKAARPRKSQDAKAWHAWAQKSGKSGSQLNLGLEKAGGAPPEGRKKQDGRHGGGPPTPLWRWK